MKSIPVQIRQASPAGGDVHDSKQDYLGFNGNLIKTEVQE